MNPHGVRTAALTALMLPLGAAAQEGRPNIVLFMVDDMGWQDTSVPFWERRTPLNDTYETPNMERLASEGMLFTQAYASPISSPSRCSLLTGANAARHRVTNWTLRRGESTDIADDDVETPSWNWNGICQTEGTPNTFVGRSFVDILHASGYHTIHCGKAHWGAIDTPGEVMLPADPPPTLVNRTTATMPTDGLRRPCPHQDWRSTGRRAPSSPRP